MTNDLKPCPFCGGEARIIANPYVPKFCVGCDDDTCLGFSGLGWLYDSEQEAAEAWNRRAGTTCEQRRARRTCRYVRDHMGVAGNWFCKCSECGAEFDERVVDRHFVYCPECGARLEGAGR